MNLAELIQNHVKEIDTAARGASRQTRGEADLGQVANMFNARINRVDARIALLERQRAESEARFVGAIEEQKKLREQMEKEAQVWAQRTPTKPGTRAPADPATATTRPTAGTRISTGLRPATTVTTEQPAVRAGNRDEEQDTDKPARKAAAKPAARLSAKAKTGTAPKKPRKPRKPK